MKTPHKGCVYCGRLLSDERIRDAERGAQPPCCPDCFDVVLAELASDWPWWPTGWFGCWFLAGRIWQFRPNGKFE